MTPEQFVYWLQGYFELTGQIHSMEPIDGIAAANIREHLQTVFHKITNDYEKVQPVGTSNSTGRASTC